MASMIWPVLIVVVRTVALSLVLSSTKISCSAFKFKAGDLGLSIKKKKLNTPVNAVIDPRIIITLFLE